MQNNNNERLWKKKTLPYTTELEARHKSITFNNLLKKYLNYERA